MKKFLIVMFILIGLGTISFFVADDSLPEGQAGPDAEALAEKMLNAIDHKAWEKIPIVAWSFRDAHHFVWDKKNHVCQVKWDDYEVVIDLNNVSGRATKSGKELKGDDLDEAIQSGWAHFCNDSFWLNAPAKIKDPGTIRKVVMDEEGNQQLLVQYSSGGVTPGDAYLWQLDEDYLPSSYKMWVSIIPVGGVEATWEDWVELDGAMISTQHEMGPVGLSIGNLEAGKHPKDFGLNDDYFTSVLEK